MKRRTKGIFIILAASMLTGCVPKHYLEDGLAYLAEAQYEDAAEAFQKEAEREKNRAEAYRGLGMAYYEMEEYEKALQAFGKSLENGGKDTGVLCHLKARCHMALGDYEAALLALQAGVLKEDLSAELKQEMQFQIIAVYEKLQNWGKAKEAAAAYTAQYPDDKTAAKEAEFLDTQGTD